MNLVSIGTIMRISTALLVMLAVSAPGLASVNPHGYYLKNEHKFEQDVEGEGYAMVYQNVNTKTLQLKNYMHGSGTLDAATLIASNQSSGTKWSYSRDTGKSSYSWKKTDVDSGMISFVEQNEMTYSPMAMVYGTGWYEKNPIVFNSKLKERTEGKSYQEGVSMLHQIEYASAFKKDIGVDLECVEPTKVGAARGYGLARMKIEEEVVEGVVHIGQLVTNPKSKDHGWKKPLIEIDENYHGTFRIVKNMEYCADKGSAPSVAKDWLSCCFGSYDGIHDDDKIGIAEKEVFDCTCRDVAWGKTWEDKSKAQYCKEC